MQKYVIFAKKKKKKSKKIPVGFHNGSNYD